MSAEKKIIIDEDWKSQVLAEKEAAQQQAAGGKPPAGQETAPDETPMPPATLEMLLTTLVTEAMIALGQVPYPGTGEAIVRLSQAKYLIDTIDMLREKTKGNVTADEAELMDHLLHQLRMAYLTLETSGTSTTARRRS